MPAPDPGPVAPPWTAVVLAGGRATRLGGAPKAGIEVAGRTLLGHLLAALPDDVTVVVVGDPMPLDRPVVFTREDPPFGGPAAGLAAGLSQVTTPMVGLLGVDMPRAVPVLLDLLALAHEGVDGIDGVDALVPVGPDGRRQPLCSVLNARAARLVLADGGGGQSLAWLFDHLRVREVRLDDEQSACLLDIDTPGDLDHARALGNRD